MPGHPDVLIIPGTPESIIGSWRDPDGGAVVTFASDGTLTGTDGCNIFQSTWTLTTGSSGGGTGHGAVITIAPFPATMMACVGPWSPWILSMGTIRHGGKYLLALNAGVEDGVEIGRLIPAVPA